MFQTVSALVVYVAYVQNDTVLDSNYIEGCNTGLVNKS